ncbi:hypothetical protein [Streptomyces subrutilus]|uniref:hypothetical protein n=1 Tax=Streptomyces subrutilus TaxID=36818 RepID=UPI00114D005E|nr:hypothetical protein [Streptomyces subrutilus]
MVIFTSGGMGAVHGDSGHGSRTLAALVRGQGDAVGAAEWLSAVAAAGSVVTAAGAWKVAAQARDTADQAALTAAAAAQIERDRLHHEFTPKFDVHLVRQNPGSPVASLTITWDGPSTLERLTEVRVFVRDDGVHRTSSATGVPPSAEEIAQTVWGPYRLRPGVSGASSDGRTATHRDLELGGRLVLAMEPTLRPSWMRTDDWYQTGVALVRLRIEAVHPAYRPWQQVFSVGLEPSWDALP